MADRGDFVDESPASPPVYDSYASPFARTTRVVVETEESLFAIDRVGRPGYSTAAGDREQGESSSSSNNPSSFSSSRNNQFGSRGGENFAPREHRDSGESNRNAETTPFYEVEKQRVIGGTSTREEDSPALRPKNCCWNCQGDHMITDCPVPRDGKRIALNRKNFLAAKAKRMTGLDFNNGGGGRMKRYHQDQPVRAAKPGDLSAELRFAMDLSPNEVPLHVYRMRIFGYPPGWLDNAMEEVSSGLKLFGDSITMSAKRKEPTINPDNIVTYPGFNCPMPFGEPDRWKELGCPRYRIDDSVEKMLRDLNDQKLISDGDGIVSQESIEPPQWDSLAGLRLDRPVLNDGASHGIGRGRFVEVESLPLHLQPGTGRGRGNMPKSSAYSQRIDREPRPIRNKPVIIPQDLDERYLPTHNKSDQKRSRRSSRSASPSLLRDGGAFEETRVPSESSGRDSPVILNLPPVPGPSRNNTEPIAAAAGGAGEDSDTGTGVTGSSNDFAPNAPPPPKKKKKEQPKSKPAEIDDDDEVMIINDDDENKDKPPDTDYDSDCLVIDNDIGPPSSAVKATPKSTPKKASPAKPPPPDIVQVDSLDSDDWGARMAVVQKRRVASKRKASAGSDTGDEEMFDNNNKAKKATTAKPSTIREDFDEDWEAGSNGSDKLVIDEGEEEAFDRPNHTRSNQESRTQSPTTNNLPAESSRTVPEPEFIPANPEKEAIRDIFLAHIDDELEETEKSFNSLPAFEKFAQGMPEMVFEEVPIRTGRLDKVLQALKTRKKQ